MFLSSRLYVTDCEKNMKFTMNCFIFQIKWATELELSLYISKYFLPDEDKTAKFDGRSGMQIDSCGHVS